MYSCIAVGVMVTVLTASWALAQGPQLGSVQFRRLVNAEKAGFA